MDFRKTLKFFVEGFPSKNEVRKKIENRVVLSAQFLQWRKVTLPQGPKFFSKELEKQEANVVLKFADDTKLR